MGTTRHKCMTKRSASPSILRQGGAELEYRNNSWFQFNDENITKMKSLSETSKRKPIVIDVDDSDEKALSRKNRMDARKRRRVESDEENASGPLPSNDKKAISRTDYRTISSKDAYMLIYARKVSDPMNDSLVRGGQPSHAIPVPPSNALAVVASLNAAHDEACDSYAKKQSWIKARFQERRRKVMSIYERWNVESVDADCFLVSRQALSAWLSQLKEKSANIIAQEERGQDPLVQHLLCNDIICIHGEINPNKSGNIKRIRRVRTRNRPSDD
ncbi:hypothetical protein H0H81_000928 [Sphagnurus paluster]|uniref:Uncharacterized protein n=1 Tax=Sphagnurus paluster TaxID=117069 RepID=A0A9P7FTG4_9AGAR|nr:hypothetical protein H0H81_000928 [Sphagnurus paluster]